MTLTPAVPGLEPTFDVTVRVGNVADYGMTRAGHRRVIDIVGGEITGSIHATILPGGADWQLVRPDGTLDIDGRYSAATASGELIYITVSGVRGGSPETLEALLRGEAVDPSQYYFRTTLTLETSAPSLAHLEQSLFIASCVREADAVRYRAYRVT
ncbi:DUF3237 domain-containing protein [Salinibacterium sp. NG253]|uniref:DUF3237 domain-containing protein n=1 Tax=Salinibacterium sp. NG253 TaxID=2792039 RepID=UPI0018CE1F7B|nr:DUF3237 domain-containing protein [Salinibacterium sp. NG253]MBH0116694.1 DUF3237 domain-containing protein [Salinibacterium sp. NG253]